MVSYDTEAILINALGDEWGGGELWDLYESIENKKQFFAVFVYIFAIMFLLIPGIIFLVVYFLEKDKKNLATNKKKEVGHFLFLGIGLIVFSIIILVAYHFL